MSAHAWPDNRGDMPWGARDILPGAGKARDENLRRDYQKLIGIRKAHPALTRGTHTGLSTEGNLYVFASREPQSGDAVVVAVNRGAEPANAQIAAPTEWAGRAVVDLLDGSQVGRGGAPIALTVGPRQARILAAP